MTTVAQRKMSLEEFLELPEEKPALELEPDGTVIQKMSPKGRHSALQDGLCRLINAIAMPARLGRAFPELRTVFGGAAYVPDVAVYRWERIPWTHDREVPDDFTEPPDIAIEIVSPEQSVNSLLRRSLWYVDNGVNIALVVDPQDRSVASFSSGQVPKALSGSDRIDLMSVLPGFELTVEQVFSALREEID
jgi:Uma2 family endonuclease